jgi:hypothetical protein
MPVPWGGLVRCGYFLNFTTINGMTMDEAEAEAENFMRESSYNVFVTDIL